ncbi:MAG: pentapeptide repeat-containing protein [Crocinitomicaceae bacterium]|nr:pentapeptide repeat-containing protein [Crocinitomicaceae bacterium]
MKETIYDKDIPSYNKETLRNNDFDVCRFISCDFENADFRDVNFSECEFIDCNLSNSNLLNTAFKDCKFINCKLLGLRFEDCNPFLLVLDFDSCILSLSSFYKLNLKGTSFANSTLNEVDFSETNLSKSIFFNCDLSLAIFDQSILIESDFRNAHGYVIDPDNNQIKKAKFSKDGISGLLAKYHISIS